MTSVEDRLAKLEAESAIRAVITRYFALCDRLDDTTPMDELTGLFCEDAVWAGRGARYRGSFGEQSGRAAITAMFERYRGPVPHFAMNAHFLTSETITVEGSSATGGWMMLQTSTYADGRSDLRSARITVQFALADGRWRIRRFETKNIFSRPIDRWDDAAPVPVPPSPTGG